MVLVTMGFGKDGKGAILRENTTVALSTLSGNTALKVDGADLAITEDFRLMKSEIFGNITGLTAGEGEGILLGLASDELTVAEIAAAINAAGPLDRNDRASMEAAERPVWLIGAYSPAIGSPASPTEGHFVSDNGGARIVHKMPWTFSNPEGWVFFVMNTGSSLQTGASVRIVATHFGVWVT